MKNNKASTTLQRMNATKMPKGMTLKDQILAVKKKPLKNIRKPEFLCKWAKKLFNAKEMTPYNKKWVQHCIGCEKCDLPDGSSDSDVFDGQDSDWGSCLSEEDKSDELLCCEVWAHAEEEQEQNDESEDEESEDEESEDEESEDEEEGEQEDESEEDVKQKE